MILGTLKTYWQSNSTLNTALPFTKVFLDFVPDRTAFPYARLSVIGNTPQYMTASTHIETFSYQLTIFHSDFGALSTIADTIMGQLDQSYPSAGTMIHTRTNRLTNCEETDGKPTYSYILAYDWTYNSQLA